MKKLLVIFIAGFVIVMSQSLRAVTGDDDEGIPLRALAGKYSSTAHGSYALCLDPTNQFAEISCSDKKAVVFPQTEVDVGNGTQDAKGSSCTTYTGTISDQPPDVSPPAVAVFHIVAKDKGYDPATGSGDGTYTGYSGGNCVGAKFNSSGATIISSGSFHFVAGNDGKRTDFNLTADTDPVGGIGDFSYYGTNLRQQRYD
jgi:hypothetical protein